ncbi:unnamed protein product [Rangifer tarandus platyrhynchus]|uniref:Uncharacterized protein n=1 Tax=Rangifer tarandus platyrhynchus TaxID=3082113 RepID=A0AC59YVC1_RANTA
MRTLAQSTVWSVSRETVRIREVCGSWGGGNSAQSIPSPEERKAASKSVRPMPELEEAAGGCTSLRNERSPFPRLRQLNPFLPTRSGAGVSGASDLGTAEQPASSARHLGSHQETTKGQDCGAL